MTQKPEAIKTTHAKMIEETQQKLIVSARKAFIAEGYAATSMDDFTAKVGLTRGALYHHFGSKKGLFAAVVRQIDSEVDQELLEISDAELDPWQGLFLRGCAYLKMALRPEIQQILLKDAKAVLGEELSVIQMQCLDSVSLLLERAMQEGRITHVNPHALAVLINGSLTEAAFWIATSDVPEMGLKDALSCWEVLMKGLLKISK